MRSAQITTGRQFCLVFDDGEDFFATLDAFCKDQGIRQALIPGFIAGFRDVELVGTHNAIENPDAPVWEKVRLENAEAHGSGTLAWDETNDAIAPHIHVSVGLKGAGATGHTSHLLGATVAFLTEMLVIEVLSPELDRVREPSLHDAPLLRFGSSTSPA